MQRKGKGASHHLNDASLVEAILYRCCLEYEGERGGGVGGRPGEGGGGRCPGGRGGGGGGAGTCVHVYKKKSDTYDSTKQSCCHVLTIVDELLTMSSASGREDIIQCVLS